MPIQDYERQRCETLQRAADNGDLALLECKEATTGERVVVLCAAWLDGNTGEVQFTPLARLCSDPNPFESFVTPMHEETMQ